MRPHAPVLAALGAVLTSCAVAVSGTPTAAPDPAIGRNVVDVLPTASELSDAVGIDIGDNDFPPTVGDARVLPDGIRNETDASEVQCFGVTSPGMALAYEQQPVWAVASQRWQSTASGLPLVFIDVSAIALTSDEAATAAVKDFTDQWRDCEGKTVVVHDVAGTGYEFAHEVDEVSTERKLLTATVLFGEEGADPAVHQRALAVRANCIVDVEVSFITGSGRPPGPDGLAVKVAELMLDRIDAAR